jgi:hypothetical protein
MDWFDAKPDRRSDGKQDKNRQNKQLCEFEWRLGLCRNKRMQRRNFFKRLYYADENVEIKSDHRCDDVDPAPRAGEVSNGACQRKYLKL